jgi:hypothetical protein
MNATDDIRFDSILVPSTQFREGSGLLSIRIEGSHIIHIVVTNAEKR